MLPFGVIALILLEPWNFPSITAFRPQNIYLLFADNLYIYSLQTVLVVFPYGCISFRVYDFPTQNGPICFLTYVYLCT